MGHWPQKSLCSQLSFAAPERREASQHVISPFGGKAGTQIWGKMEYSLVSGVQPGECGVQPGEWSPLCTSLGVLLPPSTSPNSAGNTCPISPALPLQGRCGWCCLGLWQELLFFFCLFRATPMSCGGSQAGGLRATAASLHYSHSNARSRIEPATSWFLVGCFNHWAMMGTPAVTSLRSPFWSPHSLVPLGHSLKSEPRTPWAWTPFHQISAHSSVIQRAGNMNDKEN